MTRQSEVKIEQFQLWHFDLTVLSDGLSEQGKLIRRDARRLVARAAVSKAGEYPGKDSGTLAKTISFKKFRSGLGVYITHKMKSGQYRYPFALVNGSAETGLEPRADYIADTFESRKVYVQAMLRSSLRKSIRAEEITL